MNDLTFDDWQNNEVQPKETCQGPKGLTTLVEQKMEKGKRKKEKGILVLLQN